jgi:hypothetical protein
MVEPLAAEERALERLAPADRVWVQVPVGGGGVCDCTVQACEAGEASVLPAPSVARTEKVCELVARELSALGDAHEAHEPESSLHWKLEPLSEAEKPKLASVEVVVEAGPLLIVVSGAVVSVGGVVVCTVQTCDAGLASVLPEPSVARTEKVCEPTARELSALGEEQEAQEFESSLHWKLEPPSEAEKAKLALVDAVVPEGPETIVVWGAVVSAGGVGTGTGFVGRVGVLAGGVGVGERIGWLAGLRGSVPARTSAPSPNPSPSVSNLYGFVLVRCCSVQVVSPSRSPSAWLRLALNRWTDFAGLTRWARSSWLWPTVAAKAGATRTPATPRASATRESRPRAVG